MGTLRISVRVRPGSSRPRVGGRHGEGRELVVAVSAPPVDGAANEAVLRAVAESLGVRPRQVVLVSGHTGRSKVVSIDVPDEDEAAVRARIEALLE